MSADTISRTSRRIGPATGLAADLARRLDETGRPIRVGLIGSGEMGTDIVTQCQQMTGITVAAIAEINLAAARKALSISGRPEDALVEAATASAFAATLESGKTSLGLLGKSCPVNTLEVSLSLSEHLWGSIFLCGTLESSKTGLGLFGESGPVDLIRVGVSLSEGMWNSIFLSSSLESSKTSLSLLGKGGPINLFGVCVSVNLGSRNGGDESENGVLVHVGDFCLN